MGGDAPTDLSVPGCELTRHDMATRRPFPTDGCSYSARPTSPMAGVLLLLAFLGLVRRR